MKIGSHTIMYVENHVQQQKITINERAERSGKDLPWEYWWEHTRVVVTCSTTNDVVKLYITNFSVSMHFKCSTHSGISKWRVVMDPTSPSPKGDKQHWSQAQEMLILDIYQASYRPVSIGPTLDKGQEPPGKTQELCLWSMLCGMRYVLLSEKRPQAA